MESVPEQRQGNCCALGMLGSIGADNDLFISSERSLSKIASRSKIFEIKKIVCNHARDLITGYSEYGIVF